MATDILGKGGRDMLEAVMDGEQDADVLADLARGRLRSKLPDRLCRKKSTDLLELGEKSKRGLIMVEQNPFKWRHFQADIILLCVRWYIRYALSYRDLEEMMMERGLQVDHTTMYRWVQRYAPELEKRCCSHLKVTNDS
ncbi:hypothetical protein KSC_017800 [Ktedonobacter sp. SOSP1-52]|nr:hypothetical protein KSC_017800 [Ktedonobacter sp. SOSP1-52]